MTRQIMKLEFGGRKFTIIHHNEDKIHPFWVYRHTWGLRDCGYGMSEKKRIEVKFSDLKSCLYYLGQTY